MRLDRFVTRAIFVVSLASWVALHATPPPLAQGPGGPILVIGTPANQFSYLYAEILRAEGMNAFATIDLSDITAATLADFDVAILGEMPLTAAQVTMFTNWVNAGGNLVVMRPDKQLTALLGLVDAGTTLTNAYLLVNTSTPPGMGIANQTLQFHGTADRYALNGATAVAYLYQALGTATTNPAIVIRFVGSGSVAAFTYDLAKSVVYTRQGNPAWAGQPRDQYWSDNHSPFTSHMLFYGAAPFDPQPDWIDFNRIAIPQADEQQRLLINLIEFMNLTKKPVPRFWYLPFNYKAVVVMTGDDHANGGTAGRFDQYLADSAPGCSVANWQCIRSTSLLYPGSPLTNTQALTYSSQGFDVGLHVTTNCLEWTPASLDSAFSSQLLAWRGSFSSAPLSPTQRIHCTVWSDWASVVKTDLKYGMRYDMTYSTGPNYWVLDRVGFMSGTGFPMRFADVDGTMIDVYQGNNIMWDGNGTYSQSEPLWINTLLDNAQSSLGYYGVIGVLAHTDMVLSTVSDAIVASAMAHGVPVVSASQMLSWLDARNSSTFGPSSWSSNTLSFSISPGAGSNGLQAMLPAQGNGVVLASFSQNGSPVNYSVRSIKGISYAVFPASAGSYQAAYQNPAFLPAISTQPVSTWVTPEQSATFSVQATGGVLAYQWQVQPPGGANFTSIPGAVSSTYTTNPASLSDLGTQFQCMVTNSAGVVISNAVTLTVLPPGANLVSSYSPGLLRNNFTGWVGMSILVGSAPITVNALGRIFIPGNTAAHAVKIVNASTGLDVTSANVNAALGGSGFIYSALPAPVRLTANTTYYIVSQETAGGDQWFDVATAVQTTSVATDGAAVYGAPYALSGSGGNSYGPVDFRYVPVIVSPSSVTLAASQSQQFTASTVGTSTSSMIWSINPAVGSITSGGLYTAPGAIVSAQAINVTATSAGNPTNLGTATISLLPPAPPAITKPPQNANVPVGQTATFTIVALGSGLNFQWASKPPGAASFTPIAGATASSYITGPVSATDSGAQFICVVSNVEGTVTSNAATLIVLPPGTNFIISKTLGHLRNNFTGWVGMSVTTGAVPLVVSSLGRLAAPGNTQPHTLKIVDASTGLDVPGGHLSINTANAVSGTFVYGGLTGLVTLNANATYYFVSQETQAGDQWYDNDTIVQTTTAAILGAPVYGTPYSTAAGLPAHMYGPVDFVYYATGSVTVAPATANVSASQTQQFTATIAGSANAAVSWTINPSNLGSISASGLYTAPASIGASQQVTIAATSVADISKFATATVTLSAAAPIITQQPQNASVTAGQTASFSVTATGGGLSYQWQSMLPGAANFSTIPGAVSSSYTTPATSVSDSGTQFLCLVSNAQGTVTSAVAILTVLSTGTNFVTSKTLGHLRNNFGGWTGMSVTVGTVPLSVSSLGRLAVAGNTGSHILKIVDAVPGNDVAGGSVSIGTLGAIAGNFVYGTLAAPVTLTANSTYYILSQESQGGDQWYDNDTIVQTTNVCGLGAPVYGTPYAAVPGLALHTYGPVDFVYNPTISVNVMPSSAILSSSQTQQFAATVVGSNNTAVTWSTTPSNAGSISPTGLYTAPAVITATQPVTVTATSLVDPTKFAIATLTLTLPPPPSISQQPQNATTIVGQTATFSVTATGGSLTYQWQSMPNGASSFNTIAGAVSSSYTTPATVPTDNGTQFRCVISNPQGTVGTNAATLTVLAAGTNFVTGRTFGHLRNNFGGWVGITVTVASAPLAVSALGRMVAPGNTGTHIIKIVAASTGLDVLGGSVSIGTSGGSTGIFAYGSLASPVTLNPNSTYYILSQEALGGDQWYDNDTTVLTTPAGVLTAPVYGTPYTAATGMAGHAYGPIDFIYNATVLISLTPATASLSGSQTQQFTGTVTGNSNTAVTWAISPNNAGSISSTGLYTAPASIAVTQQVTVMAISVADPTRSANAAVTLNLPAPPTITQSPQNTTAVAGQTANFTVAAIGGGLTYQWQSMPPGAGGFSAILGAVSSSYTTPGTAAADSGTQFRCVVTNAQGTVTSNPATLTVLAAGTNFVTSKTLGKLRNSFTGWVGMSVIVGAAPVTVTALGRMVAPSNASAHIMKIVTASSGLDVPGASVSIGIAGGTTGSFTYGTLAVPVTLNANTAYYILSQETQGGVQFYDNDTTVQTSTAAVLTAPVYGTPYVVSTGKTGHTYGPLDFIYNGSGSVNITPATVSLLAAQTQQFTATVVGNSSVGVAWTISPSNAGSISPAGLYTAPASITATQSVTVMATSVADPTKFSTATVTLNPPPAPPVITQQPQSATVVVGQTASFSVTAAGTGLTYQWQSMVSGGASFGAIAGAISSSYTTPTTALADNRTQFRCLVSNAQGTLTSNAAVLTVVSSGTNFVIAKTLGRIRSDYTGFVGMKISVSATPVVVSALGRFVAPGNSGVHTLKLADSAGNDIAGGSVSVGTSGGTAGTFVYAALPSLVTLSANGVYYILSQETMGGDQWYDNDTTAQTTADAVLSAAAWGSGPPYVSVAATTGHMYGPLDFKYTAIGQ